MQIERYIIYALVDPITQEIRYVGRSSSGDGRCRYHFAHSLEKQDDGSWASELYVHRWIRSLYEQGSQPQFVVLESFEESDDVNDRLNEAEIKWIAKKRGEGCHLTNLTEGGGGVLGYHHTEESKQKLARCGESHHFFGKTHSEETRQKISKRCKGLLSPMTGKIHTEKTKQQIRSKLLGSKRPQTSGDNHWTHRTCRGPNTGKKFDAVWRQHMSNVRRGRVQSIEERRKKSKPVVRLNDGKVFLSMFDAANDSHTSLSTVSRCCNLNVECRGLRFAFVTKEID